MPVEAYNFRETAHPSGRGAAQKWLAADVPRFFRDVSRSRTDRPLFAFATPGGRSGATRSLGVQPMEGSMVELTT